MIRPVPHFTCSITSWDKHPALVQVEHGPRQAHLIQAVLPKGLKTGKAAEFSKAAS
jgi:hypothetical protein